MSKWFIVCHDEQHWPQVGDYVQLQGAPPPGWAICGSPQGLSDVMKPGPDTLPGYVEVGDSGTVDGVLKLDREEGQDFDCAKIDIS